MFFLLQPPSPSDQTIEEPAQETIEESPIEEPEEEIEEETVMEEPEEIVDESEPSQKEYGAGMYIINDDIEPGIYRSEGGVTYFERLAGLSGELDDILANEASPSGPVYVEIKSTDVAFKTEGGGKWYKVDLDKYKGVMLTSFGDGWYIVGKDIIPGRYRSDDGCDYWARLKDFSGDLNSIITNSAFDEGTVIVEIQSSDFGFQTQGANWEKMEEVQESKAEGVAEKAEEEVATEEVSKTEEEEATGKQQNVSNIQPIIDSATDSLGHTNTNSWVKDTSGDWSWGGLEASPTIYIGDVITFTINVSNSTTFNIDFNTNHQAIVL